MSDPLLRFAGNPIETRSCTTCEAPMVLARINTARLAFDICTFECFNCDNINKVMTETRRVSPFAGMPPS